MEVDLLSSSYRREAVKQTSTTVNEAQTQVSVKSTSISVDEA